MRTVTTKYLTRIRRRRHRLCLTTRRVRRRPNCPISIKVPAGHSLAEHAVDRRRLPRRRLARLPHAVLFDELLEDGGAARAADEAVLEKLRRRRTLKKWLEKV